MPLLIFHCRTRLFLAIIQQRAILGGTRTLLLSITVAGTANDFHIIPHHDSIHKYNTIVKNICQTDCSKIEQYLKIYLIFI